VIYQVVFWIIYWCIYVYIEFDWAKQHIPTWSAGKIVARASLAQVLYILPLIVLAYYLVFVGFYKVAQNKSQFFKNAVLIFIPYVSAICLCIVLVRLIVFPYIYENAFRPGVLFFDPRRFLSITVEAAFPAVLLMSLKYVDVQIAAKELEKKLIQEKLSGELKFLKNQLNPHFLFNTLNNIYVLTRKKSDKAPEAVMKLSELLSFMLYEAARDTIPIEKEIDYPVQPVSTLILLPLVENAFKHGSSENHFDSFIDITLTLKKQQLSFSIRNSYEEPLQKNKSNALGLQNIERQLQLLYAEQQLAIRKESNLFEVILTVNLNSYGKI